MYLRASQGPPPIILELEGIRPLVPTLFQFGLETVNEVHHLFGDKNRGRWVNVLSEARSRWWWALALGGQVAAAFYMVAVLWTRYQESPVYVTRLRSVQDAFPFPAVLIYPQLLIPDHMMDQFMENMDIPPTMNASRVRQTLPQLVAFVSPDVKFDVRDLTMLERLLAFNSMTPLQAIRRMLPECHQSLLRCGWRGSHINCSELFTMELTGDGFACVFNGRSLNREISEGIDPRSKPYTSLWFTDMVAPPSGLSVIVRQGQPLNNVDLAYKWLAVSMGGKFVDISLNGTPLSPGEEVWAGFFDRKTTVSLDAKDLSSGLRRCRLNEEESLQYFPIYSRRYCLVECEMALARRRCGCIKPTHPLISGNRICRAGALQCVRRVAVTAGESSACACPSACDTYSDEVHIQTSNLEMQHYSYDSFYEGVELANVTVVRVYVLRYHAPWYERRPVYVSLHLFSNLGGVFNIYLGCSVITLLEVFMLLKHYFNDKCAQKKQNTERD